jgi:light-regulated signal transduction histidine kinase (bacteriophytochrome)
MSEELLRQSHADLERMVEIRTKQIQAANTCLKEEIERKQELEDILRKALSDLTFSNNELRQFAYVASHDLKEPLRNITMTLQMLERKYKDSFPIEAKNLAQMAMDSASRMSELIDDLLLYSRVGSRDADHAIIDVGRIVADVLKDQQTIIDELNAEIIVDQLPCLPGDPVHLRQVFQNLISNALKFHGDNTPQIYISARKLLSEWEFTVRDNGIGIESRFLERIFEIFQRLHSRSAYAGNGIGLSIVKKIIELSGGRIWVESELGIGTRFYFTLPATSPLSAISDSGKS